MGRGVPGPSICSRRACGTGPGKAGALRREHFALETDEGGEFREPGFSKERRLDPRITIGLRTGVERFLPSVLAFEGTGRKPPR